MQTRALFFLTFALSVCLIAGAADSAKVAPTQGLPKGLSEKIAAQLDPAGLRVAGPEGPLFSIWLAKSVDVKADFKPTLTVKYPFNNGELIGALQIPEGSSFTDFRGQELAAGVYTLRYAQQPEDGNHIGTSDTYDFLLAVPANLDTDPKPIDVAEQLHQQSAKAAGSAHPAILYLLPAEKAPEKPALEHDASREYWILHLTASGTAKNKRVKVPMQLVAVGQALE